jgi:hypothetical protein
LEYKIGNDSSKKGFVLLIDGMELDLGVVNLTTQRVWKIRNKKIKSNIVLNLGDAQIEVI